MTYRGVRLSSDRARARIAPVAASADVLVDGPDRHRRVSRGLLAVWWLLFLAGTVGEPVPDGEVEALGALDAVLTLAALATLVAVTSLLACARRGDARGGWAAFGGGLYFLGLSLACPATGHHAIGGWWYVQLVTSLGMVAVGLVAVRHASARR
jgi:hypothetical protein